MSKSRLPVSLSSSAAASKNANAALLSSNEFVAVAATSLFWDVVVATAALSLDATNLATLASLCHGAFSAVASPKVKAKWAIKRYGSRNAMAAMYSKHPKALSASTVHALLANGAVLPRHLVLLLVREKLAIERHQIKLEEHFKYQREVKRMLEWRAMELESQRMMGNTDTDTKPKRDIHDQLTSEIEEENSAPANSSHPDDTPLTSEKVDIALVPLPTYSEIPTVPYPDPVPETLTRRLPIGARDALLQEGEALHGSVFYAKNAPSSTSERLFLLPEEVHWTAALSHAVAANGGAKQLGCPVLEWPFDDAALFVYLVRYGAVVRGLVSVDTAREPVGLVPFPEMETGESAGANGRAWQEGDENTTASTDTERRGSQDLVAAPSTSFAVSKNQENWKRICEALRSLIDKHGFDPRFVVDAEGVLGNLAVFQQKGIALDFHMGEALDVENSWILGEVLHHDEKLGRLLAKAGGVPDHIVEEEVLYWMLVDTKIQVPLKRHSPLLPAEELYMRQQVAKLPSPIPVPTLRRFIRNHASKLVVARLVEYTATPAIQLRDIADDLIASLVSPANLAANRKPEAALHRVDTLVDAFGVQPFELLAHFVIPGWENFVDGDNVATAGPAVVAKAAGAVDSDEFEDLFSAYASSRVQLLTKIGAESGVVPWSYWNYLVVRYTSPSTVLRESWKGTPVARTVVSILVHDLAVRRAAAGDDRDEAKRWFSEKEADKALAALLKSVRASGVPVEVFKGTVMEVGRRILEAVQNGCVGLAVVPERFVAVMEVVEGIVLTAAGPRQVGENVEEVKHLEMEQVEPVPVPVQVTGSTPSLVRLWVQILNIIFLENPDWQALVDESSTTEEILDDTPVPIHIKFYWAVASLVEDALNVHTGAHAKFRNWVTELEAVAASAPVGVASKKEGSATTLSGLTSSLFYRVAEFGSVLAHSKAAESVGNVGSKIASSSVVTGTTAVIGKRIANSGVVETVGHAGATVTAGISSIASTLQKTLGHKDSVAELKAKEEVLAAAGAGAVKPVSLIGTEKESEKQARDAAWDRLSSRLSTAKKE